MKKLSFFHTPYFLGVPTPLFASLTLVKETALKEAASLKSPLLTSFIEKELLHIDLLNSFVPQMQNT